MTYTVSVSVVPKEYTEDTKTSVFFGTNEIPLELNLSLIHIFYFAIKKWDLKTPGREDDDVEAEKKAVLTNNDYTAVAKTILEGRCV